MARSGPLAYARGVNNLYAVLLVDPGADREVIRATYRVLARRFHPDHGGDQAKMVELAAAWAILGHAARRAEYDLSRRELSPPEAPIPAQRPSAATDLLDFGRYQGWTVTSLADHDPDYLEWLARAPAGRAWRDRIDTVLAARQAAAATLVPKPKTTRGRRTMWGARR